MRVQGVLGVALGVRVEGLLGIQETIVVRIRPYD